MTEGASLKALVRELVRRYEARHGLELTPGKMVELFGFAEAKSIEAMLEGHMLRRELADVLAVVAVLEGDDEDARLLTRVTIPMVEPLEDTSVMNDRLMRRVENLERFLKRIGKLEEFHDWLTANDKLREA